MIAPVSFSRRVKNLLPLFQIDGAIQDSVAIMLAWNLHLKNTAPPFLLFPYGFAMLKFTVARVGRIWVASDVRCSSEMQHLRCYR